MSQSYVNFINKFKIKYKFKFFDEKINKSGDILLRHDVDYDTDYALYLAKINNKLGIKSTFFFLLRSEFYNLISKKNILILNSIEKLGAKIGLHFNESIYNKAIKNNFLKEIKILQQYLKNKINIISFHRPVKNLINFNKKYYGFNHTYMNKFSKEIIYFSDSQNKFRFGNPVNSLEYKDNMSMQILLHPIWWKFDFNKNSNYKFKKYLNNYSIKLKKELSENSKIFKVQK